MAWVGSDALPTCERCHGSVTVEAADGGSTRVRCTACGHTWEVQGQDQPDGKWTLIAPDGQVTTFASWEELAAFRQRPPPKDLATTRPPAGVSTPPGPTGAELLDVTPTRGVAKLALAEESDANIAGLVAVTRTPAKEDKAPDSIAELDANALVPDHSDDEPVPLSLRDAIIEEDEPAELSLRDVVLVARVGDKIDSTPPPPARGALRTLPPTASIKGKAVPPTIKVEDTTESKETTEEEASKPKASKKAQVNGYSKKRESGRSKASKKSGTKKSGNTSTDKRQPVAPARASAPEEESKPSWVLPGLAVAAGAILIWYNMAASPSSGTREPQTTTATTTETTTTTTTTATTAPTPTSTESRPVSPPAVLPSAATAPTDSALTTAPPAEKQAPHIAPATTNAGPGTEMASPPGSATTEKPRTERPTTAADNTATATEKKAAVSNDSMSELLDRAASARRSGDYATARELYERVLRQSPGNVEANGGLGDVARALGDFNSAKASYERALATSPSYGPAQLGLADTEWDLGNRAGAQRRYAQIVERLGDRAPERAKQRSAATE